jgi:hypothetical protein
MSMCTETHAKASDWRGSWQPNLDSPIRLYGTVQWLRFQHSTGVCIDKGQFSRDLVGTVVRDFLYISTQLSDCWWDLIMTLCGNNKEPPVLMMHLVHVNCRAMYEPSSPIMESDDDEWCMFWLGVNWYHVAHLTLWICSPFHFQQFSLCMQHRSSMLSTLFLDTPFSNAILLLITKQCVHSFHTTI